MCAMRPKAVVYFNIKLLHIVYYVCIKLEQKTTTACSENIFNNMLEVSVN